MEEIYEHLEGAAEAVSKLRSQDRDEHQRRLAVLATEIEKALAWAKHTGDAAPLPENLA